MQLIAALFPDRAGAERALERLEQLGVAQEQVSVVMREQGALQREAGRPQAEITEAGGDGAVRGMAIGSLGGLLLGLAAIALPGIGPVLAIGPLASALGFGAMGAAAGGFAGGIVGGLVGAGISQQEADQYAEGVKRGLVLLTVQAESEERAAALAASLRASGALDINEESTAWRGDSARGHGLGSESEADFPPLEMPEER